MTSLQGQTYPPHRWTIRHPFARAAVVGLDYLHRAVATPVYPVVVGVLGLLLTISFVPFASVLIASVLLSRDRWKMIVLLASLGSATGGVILYLTVHQFAWNQLAAAYPDLMQSQAWANAQRWVSSYGTLALLGVAAMPLPQTPVLFVTAITRLPIQEVFLALLVGKLLKYGIYGFLAAKFPAWFRHLAGWPDGHGGRRLDA